MYEKVIKRMLDFLIAFISLIVFLPLMLLIVFLIKIDSKGPSIYTQMRSGKNGKEFKIYKFRTMKIDTPEVAPALLGDATKYITRVGNILRKTSLDELPQLFNILNGSMSVIGPRPCLWNEFELINLRKRNNIDELVPGLTGWAQINGRDEVTIEKKVELDKYYLKNVSFLLDLKILFLTFYKVLKTEGIKEGS